MPRSLNRREFIRLAGLIAASTGVAGCASVYDRLAPAPGSWTPWPIAGSSTFSHLNRMTYGPRSEERAAADDAGIEAWIEEQLAPESLDDPAPTSGFAVSLHSTCHPTCWRISVTESSTMSID